MERILMLVLLPSAEQAVVFPNLQDDPKNFELCHTLPKNSVQSAASDHPETQEFLTNFHVYKKDVVSGETFSIRTENEIIVVTISGSSIEVREGNNIYHARSGTNILLLPEEYCIFCHGDNKTHLSFVRIFRF